MRTLLPAAALAASLSAAAEPGGVSPAGFTITHATTVEAEPDRVYQAFTQLPRWWNPAHSWSGQPGSMTLEAQAGGCWCERWGDGASAMHGRVLMVMPGSALRLQAWLGPLQEQPVAAVLTFATGKRDGATRLRVTYRVAGAPDAGLDKLAGPVDGVIGEQMKRLKAFIETGKPD